MLEEARPLLADADGVHEPVEAGAEGQGTEADVDEPFHGHDRGHDRDDAPCLPNDRVRVRARRQEGDSDQDPLGAPWRGGPLFPFPSPCLFPCLCLCLCPCPYLARVHGPCLSGQRQGQAQAKKQEERTTTRGQIQTSSGYGPCYSHDHALFPCLAGAAANLTSLAAAQHLAARPSVEEQGVLELAQEV